MYIFLKFEKNQFSKLIMLVIIKFSNSSGSEVTEISNRPFLSGSCSNWNHDQASSRSRWFTSQRVNFGILWRFGQSWVQSLSLISLTLILAVAINYICEKTWNHINHHLKPDEIIHSHHFQSPPKTNNTLNTFKSPWKNTMELPAISPRRLSRYPVAVLTEIVQLLWC